MTRKELGAFLDALEDRSWVVVLPSTHWAGPSSFLKTHEGWDDPDVLKHLWAAKRAGAVAISGHGYLSNGWVW